MKSFNNNLDIRQFSQMAKEKINMRILQYGKN
jgi:hypothetical protein